MRSPEDNRWHPCLLPDDYFPKLRRYLAEADAQVESRTRLVPDPDCFIRPRPHTSEESRRSQKSDTRYQKLEQFEERTDHRGCTVRCPFTAGTYYEPDPDAHVADEFPVDTPARDTDYIDTFYAEPFLLSPLPLLDDRPLDTEEP